MRNVISQLCLMDKFLSNQQTNISFSTLQNEEQNNILTNLMNELLCGDKSRHDLLSSWLTVEVSETKLKLTSNLPFGIMAKGFLDEIAPENTFTTHQVLEFWWLVLLPVSCWHQEINIVTSIHKDVVLLHINAHIRMKIPVELIQGEYPLVDLRLANVREKQMDLNAKFQGLCECLVKQ